MNPIRRYIRWLHTQWPAGHVEKLPFVKEDGSTNIPGVYVVGDLRGIPLLKFAADTGARAVQTILNDPSFQSARQKGSGTAQGKVVDLAIVGAGVGGMAAALEAKNAGITYKVFEASEPFSTIVNFPKGKPIYTYPKEMIPAGDLTISADVKEPLVEQLLDQTIRAGIEPIHGRVERVQRKGHLIEVVLADGGTLLARRVIVSLGRSGNFRKLGVPGEDLDHVYNRLHDPKDFCEQTALVIGGGDSALETAIALAQCGGDVTISYRKSEFSRPKPENIDMLQRLTRDPRADVGVEEPASERVTSASGGFMKEHLKPGRVRLMMGSQVEEIREREASVRTAGGESETIPIDVVFTMIGREPPLDFFRRSGIRIAGEWTVGRVAGLIAFFIFCVALYNWKSGGSLANIFHSHGWFPTSLTQTFAEWAANPKTFLGVLILSASGPSFWYTLAYSLLVVIFGFRRIQRRQTPYITVQTWVLMIVQVFPLFLLPEIVFPLLGNNGLLPEGIANALFPEVDYGHGREYWRAYGFILAWPLNVYNVFTHHPLPSWLVISGIQTLAVIPALIYFFGKGVYCGWFCSCGALAETLGDTHRHKMLHGPKWNRLNMLGQIILLWAVILLIIRIIGWCLPDESAISRFFIVGKDRYKWIVDVFLAGAVGYGAYFWFSGRVWCRFMCPLAALMHIYTRFSRFRIIPDKKKCISCNICTSVCHQGIDIMNVANKGLPMEDPECVRCSACVWSCPTGVLTFGQVDREGKVITTDRLAASPVQMVEK
ncbi:MAG: NAD(P)-binding domain-containing protein [Candidatus Latescibacteria bacterium]|nr:NAD(P)-binding domain-containing protein [Candidatus Latescibacterota bacterium]NIM64444.1 NAD(P)-binding domain-containing protein [Candidatus Latescibacterota bacterium]NIO00598.1 NAD(P)-binding domain-containing protein [Candidatus Latescibacterota bacterium]NIO26998.1 NAD(P)-binding domain-containing protein [Candidatus Latescibacterota bacterium]NIO56075.1 NAD(P)-binding domain-containing protein [Candidatus Latescibacterota bacterium]